MADRLNVTFEGLTLVDAADGSAFFESKGMTWSNVPYADAVRMQNLMLGVLDELKKWGNDKAQAKGHGKP